MNLKLHSKKKYLVPHYILVAALVILQYTDLLAQTGYIYVHSKTLNETGSPSITYSVSGGGTAVADFTLNDDPAQIIVSDIGSSESGRLWAVSNTNALYYRDPLNPNWIATGITGVRRIDGGPGSSCFYISTAGTVYSYTGAGSATQISTAGEFPSGSADIGSGWTATPTAASVTGPALYVVNNNATISKYSGSGTTWNAYTTIASNTLYQIDVNPTNGNVYTGGNNGSTRTIWETTPALAVTSLGSPVADNSNYRGLAVTENGEIYVSAFNNLNPNGWYVHKFSSGTTWVREESSYDAGGIAGGVGNALWLTMNSGGWSNGSGWTPAAGPYPFYNIFSRGFDGSEVTYIDDERVRVSPAAGNSQLIPVAPGTYTITETVPGGWDLQKISLYDPSANSSSDHAAGTATVIVQANEVVHVVFQTGEINPVNMTTDCADAYLETFGTGAVGSYGSSFNGQTTYHYLSGNAPGEDGYYKIVNRANPDFNTWSGAAGIVDHTAGDNDEGYMYAVNAGYDKGEFFRRHFTGVITGANYSFSAWIVNLTAAASVNPNVSFTVYDHATQAVLGTYSTGPLSNNSEPGSWQKYGFSFTGSSSDIDLVISNNGIGGGGNDLALDDISFSLSPPTPTIVIQNGSCDSEGSITISAPLSPDYEYSVDGTTWQLSPVFNNLTAGAYTVFVRFAGAPNCVNSSTSAVIKPSICGNVFHDANGLTDTQVNGTLISAAGTAPLFVSLYNGSTLVSTIPVNPDGTYSFLDVEPNITYTLVLGTDPAANASSPFQGGGSNGWVAVGEDCCDNTGGDGTTNGTMTISIGTSNANNANFGIELQPESDPKTKVIPQPAVNQIITLNGGTNPPVLSGSDPEDLPAGDILTGKTVVITTVPANSELYYDNTLVTDGTTINNFDPSKLTIKLTSATIGDLETQFEYAYVDIAGVADPTPAVYKISWEAPMPVTLVNFIATKSESQVLLSWSTVLESNSSHFEIERSQDAKSWNSIGRISAGKNTKALSEYDFTDIEPAKGTNYYRLKMVDLDETFAYSKIASVSIQAVSVVIYPNPVADRLTIADAQLSQIQKVVIYNTSGKAVVSSENAQHALDVSTIPKGIYVVTITYRNGTRVSQKIVKN